MEQVRRRIQEAAEPVACFWPMSRFVHHNPIQGLRLVDQMRVLAQNGMPR